MENRGVEVMCQDMRTPYEFFFFSRVFFFSPGFFFFFFSWVFFFSGVFLCFLLVAVVVCSPNTDIWDRSWDRFRAMRAALGALSPLCVGLAVQSIGAPWSSSVEPRW